MKERVKVIVHLLRAEVCPRHDVGFLDSARRRYKDIINYIEFASVLDLFFVLQMQFASYFEVLFIDAAVQVSVLRFQFYIIFINFMIFALHLQFVVILYSGGLII